MTLSAAGNDGRGDIYTVEQGTGDQVLLFVHGWGSDHTVWDTLASLASTRYRVITMDLRGHGQSAIARTPHTIPAMTNDLAAILARLRVSPTVVIGHSMGANVAVQLALQEPELISGVVCVDPAYGDPRVADAPSRAVALEQYGSSVAAAGIGAAFPAGTDPALVAHAADTLSRTDPRVLIEALRSTYLDPDAFGSINDTIRVLGALQQPLLSIYARPEVAATARTFPVARHMVRTIAGSGHFIPLTQPAELWSQIRNWLTTRESA